MCVPDAVQLLHTQHWTQVIGDLLKALLVLLVDDQEGHSLQPYNKIKTALNTNALELDSTGQQASAALSSIHQS